MSTIPIAKGNIRFDPKRKSRRAAVSAATLDSFVTMDDMFMEKVSNALQTIHDNYGYVGVQDCMKTNEITGEATVDLSVLCAMLDRSKEKVKSECCSMFFASKSIIGSFAYLFGSFLFGAVAYFGNQITYEWKALMSVTGTTFYLIGGILFIFAAIGPYWNKTLEINAMSKEMNELNRRGSIVKKMGNKRDSDNVIKARMSRFNINCQELVTGDIEEEENENDEENKGHLSEVYSAICDASSDKESQRSERSKQAQIAAETIDLIM